MKRSRLFQIFVACFWLFNLLLTGTLLTTSCKKACLGKACIVEPPPSVKDLPPPASHLSHPCANTGSEQIVFLPDNSAQLDGSNSYDSNGIVSSYYWRQISGPGQSLIVNSTYSVTGVQNLLAGIYQFELKITDTSGLFSTDTAMVVVTTSPVADCATNRKMLPVHLIPYNTLSQNKEYLNTAGVGCPCRILFAGGTDSNAINSGVDIFEVPINSRSSAMLSQARQGMGVATVDNKVFFAGGGDGDIGWVTTRVDIYDATTGQWATTELGEARSYLATATVGHKVSSWPPLTQS
jgi:hypothetical protein